MYLLDANCFIERHKQVPMDIFTGYWGWLAQPPDNVRSIVAVYEEILEGNDSLCDWAKAQKESLFIDNDYSRMSEVVEYAERHYAPFRVKEFLDRADAPLIAAALAQGATVVTYERAIQAHRDSRIKIPNVCDALGVPCLNLYAMLRTLGVRF